MAVPDECEKIRDLISLELDGEISEQQRLFLDNHLDSCSDCRHWEQALLSGLETLDSDFSVVSGELGDLIQHSLRSEDLQSPKRESVEIADARSSLRHAAIAAVFVLFGFLGFFLTENEDYAMEAEVIDASGGGWVLRGDERISLSATNSSDPYSLAFGDQLQSLEGTITLGDSAGLNVRISGDSSVRCIANREFQVIDGEAYFQLAHGRGPLKVMTDEVLVSVSGTEFLVRRWKDLGRTEVYVLDGEVMVQWGKRIPLPVRQEEWVEVSGRGFMFHSSPEPIQVPDLEPVARPAAGIGGAEQKKDGVRIFGDIPKRTRSSDHQSGPLDMPINDSDSGSPDGED